MPAALGDISPNLETMHLQLNHLSCDLPASVLGWQASSENVSSNLLDGNLFGCSTSMFLGNFALSIQGAKGLRSANEQIYDSYSCCDSIYVLPVITVAILAVPAIIWLGFLYYCGRLALPWRSALEYFITPTALINEHAHTDQHIRALALGVMSAATVASSLSLVLSTQFAKSAFECEYTAAPTLANKRESDVYVLSIGVSAAVCAGLVLGLASWWHRLVLKCSDTNAYSGEVVKNKPLYPLEKDSDAWNYDAERVIEATHHELAESSFEVIIRVLKLVVLFLAIVLFTIGPNVGYVLAVLSDLTHQQKLASEMAVTLAKTAIGTLLVPRVTRKNVDLLVIDHALTFVRFRSRMVISTALSVTTMVLIPVSIVLVTDPRCFYYIFEPQAAVETDVPILSCLVSAEATGQCDVYGTSTVKSTYTPSFTYDGERCVSAVLSVYGPVFLGVALLAATLPAGMEILIVPWLAPWCYRYAVPSSVARTGLAFLRAVTWNVWPVLSDAGVLSPDFSLGVFKLDYLALRIVERAFVQVTATLIILLTFGIAVPVVGGACVVTAFVQLLHHRDVLGQIVNLGCLEQPAMVPNTLIMLLTFGIAVPVVGGACAVAAFVQLLHHRDVLGQIVLLGRLEQRTMVPNLMGCIDIPVSCAAVVVATVTLVWVCGSVDYLEPVLIGCMLLIGLGLALAPHNTKTERKAARLRMHPEVC